MALGGGHRKATEVIRWNGFVLFGRVKTEGEERRLALWTSTRQERPLVDGDGPPRALAHKVARGEAGDALQHGWDVFLFLLNLFEEQGGSEWAKDDEDEDYEGFVEKKEMRERKRTRPKTSILLGVSVWFVLFC